MYEFGPLEPNWHDNEAIWLKTVKLANGLSTPVKPGFVVTSFAMSHGVDGLCVQRIPLAI